MNTKYYLFSLLFFTSSVIIAGTPRSPKSYSAEECAKRYGEELEYSESIVTKLKSDNVCAQTSLADSYAEEINRLLSAQEVSLNDVAHKYKMLMDLLAECRTEALLRPPTDVNALARDFGRNMTARNGLLLHVIGDKFGLNSGLEGSNASVTLAHRIRVLKAIREQQKWVFINDKDQAEPCHQTPQALADVDGTLLRNYPQPDFTTEFLNSTIAKAELALSLYEASQAPTVNAFRDLLHREITKLMPG